MQKSSVIQNKLIIIKGKKVKNIVIKKVLNNSRVQEITLYIILKDNMMIDYQTACRLIVLRGKANDLSISNIKKERIKYKT